MAEDEPRLDRVAFAIDLRRSGIAEVDFEDWDGLSDQQVVGLTQFMHRIKIDPKLVQEHIHEIYGRQ